MPLDLIMGSPGDPVNSVDSFCAGDIVLDGK